MGDCVHDTIKVRYARDGVTPEYWFCASCQRKFEPTTLKVLTFRELQSQVGSWSLKNFGEDPPVWKFVGMVEEVGDLAHALLKKKQGIRITEDHEAKAKDAVGDLLVYTADFCDRMSYDMQEIIEKVWAKVSKRDWKADPSKGGEA